MYIGNQKTFLRALGFAVCLALSSTGSQAQEHMHGHDFHRDEVAERVVCGGWQTLRQTSVGMPPTDACRRVEP